VLFNSSGLAKKIEISTGCNGIHSLIEALNESVPKKVRGKYRRRVEMPGAGCKAAYEEEYDCLRMEYVQENCMGCMPASITMIWKSA